MLEEVTLLLCDVCVCVWQVISLLKDRIMELESQLELAHQQVIVSADTERDKLEALRDCDTLKRDAKVHTCL